MQLVTGQDEIIAEFVSAGLGRKIYPPFTAMGWVLVGLDGGWKLAAGAVFNDYHGASIELSYYGRVTRQTCRDIHDYVFNQLKCLRLTARTKHGNAAVRQLLPAHGWIFEGTLKRFYGSAKSHNALIYRLDADVANRWINGQLSIAASGLQQSLYGYSTGSTVQLADCTAAGGT